MKAQLFSLAALAILSSPVARAQLAPSANPDSVLNENPQDISIPMARGELQAEVAAEVAQRERANAPRTQVEVGASSWTPSRVTTGSRIAGATDFDAKGIPAIDVSILSPIMGRSLHLEFGLGFLAVSRTGTIEATGIRVPQEENGYISTVRVGVQATPWLLLGDRLMPYASAALLPSMLVTRASSFDDGVTDTGIPFEVGAGALVRVSKPLSLDVGVRQVLGRVQESDFKGFGVRAGLRFQI